MDAIIFCYGAEVYAHNVIKRSDGGYDSGQWFLLDSHKNDKEYYKEGGWSFHSLEDMIPIKGT